MKAFSIKNRKFKKILVVQTAFLGDVILSTSIIKALSELYPESKIDIITTPQAYQILKNNPYISKIHLFDKRNFFVKLSSVFILVKSLNRENYQLAVSLKLSYTISLIMFLSRIPVRLGYPKQKLLTHTIMIPKNIPVYKRHLELLKVLSDRTFDPQTNIFWTAKEEDNVDRHISIFNKSGYFTICIAPGSIWFTKRWPQYYYSELLRLLHKDHIQAVLIGGKEDNKLCQSIIEESGVSALNMAGKLSITESAVLIAKSALIITNDSAPLHIANAVETDVIAIFGPTVKEFGFYPYRQKDILLEASLDCRPCGKHGGNKCPKKHFKCMISIKPELVLETVLAISKEKNCKKN